MLNDFLTFTFEPHLHFVGHDDIPTEYRELSDLPGETSWRQFWPHDMAHYPIINFSSKQHNYQKIRFIYIITLLVLICSLVLKTLCRMAERGEGSINRLMVSAKCPVTTFTKHAKTWNGNGAKRRTCYSGSKRKNGWVISFVWQLFRL